MKTTPAPLVTRGQARVARAYGVLQDIAAQLCDGCDYGYPLEGGIHNDHGEREECTAGAFWFAVQDVAAGKEPKWRSDVDGGSREMPPNLHARKE